ncbi:hypothetical protein Rumeso_00626 [Rubellimicrobium mesophilum DSM 19309]|uniref:DUF2127 domain-containing protein n=1 Tax=Rubellimicrobium mesophilum DSM 19309 TaxID=442562 RepID=A0A017HVW7_9RHOB|nr:DUF2127 domain-containing protein [Rubellimicrobium mesophilum]EYD77899.1 hypothetical protein Rumeso_00626 [Rubellimicrobium mesophilum DSM 19309]
MARERPDLLHAAFVLGLFGKALLGLGQFAGGVALAMSPPGTLPRLVDWMARNELAEDPTDPFARAVERLLAHANLAPGGVYTVYLLVHGLLNLFIVAGLALRLPRAHAFAMLCLAGFVAYQVSEFVRTGDPILLVLSAYDLGVILLVRHEGRRANSLPHRSRP